MVLGSRLYPGIPDTEGQGQLAAECVCRNICCNKGFEATEVPMGEKLNQTVVRYGCSISEWLNNHAFGIVLILSLMHIGLAYIHTRHSGRADYPFFPSV
jgi:hypothetical protein